MNRREIWRAALIWLGLGCALAAADPPMSEPITLQFIEAPVLFEPHDHAVSAIAFSPDGKTLASGSGCVRLWDCGTGRLKAIYADDASRGIGGLAFSPDGRLVAAVGSFFGRDAVLWDTTIGRIARDFDEVPPTKRQQGSNAGPPMIYKGRPITFRSLNAVAFSPDGQLLASAPRDVVLRDAASGSVTATLDHASHAAQAIAFAADGKTLVSAADDRKVRLWGLPSGQLQTTLSGATQPLCALAISPDGARLVAASTSTRPPLGIGRGSPGCLWSWTRPFGQPRKHQLPDGNVRQIVFLGPSTVAVTVGRDVLSFGLGNDSAPAKLWTQSQEVLSLAVSPDGRLLASGGKDRVVDLVDLSTGKLVHRLPGSMETISAVATSDDGSQFATATIDVRFTSHVPCDEITFAGRHKTFFSGDVGHQHPQSGEVRIWSAVDGRMQLKLPLPPCQVTAVKFIHRKDQIAVASWAADQGGMLSLWNSCDGKHLREFTRQSAEILSVAVAPDGRLLASGDADGHLQLWDLASGAKVRSTRAASAVRAVAFSADGTLLAAADSNHNVELTRPADGGLVRHLKYRSQIKSLDFSPDGRLLAGGTSAPGLELWNLDEGEGSRTLKASGDHFGAMPGFVAFSTDGRLLVCGGHGKDIAVFDAPTGTLLRELRGHLHAPTAAAFLGDGRLVSGGDDRTIRLWNPRSGDRLATWIALPADSTQQWTDQWLGFAPSGDFVGSDRLDRLIGWQLGGEVLMGPAAADRCRRVKNLFSKAH